MIQALRWRQWVIVDTPKVLFCISDEEPSALIREASQTLVSQGRISVAVAAQGTFDTMQTPSFDVVVVDRFRLPKSSEGGPQASTGWVFLGDASVDGLVTSSPIVHLPAEATRTQICDAVTTLISGTEASHVSSLELLVLLVDSHPETLAMVSALLSDSGVPVGHTERAGTLEEARVSIATTPPDVIIVDSHLPDSKGLDTVRTLRQAAPTSAIVVLTDEDDESTALQAVLIGADDYLVKEQVDRREIWRSLRYATQRKRFEHRVAYLSQFDRLTGLLNRYSFAGRLSDAVKRAQMTGHELVLMLVDLDRFKAVRKWLTPSDADDLIREVAHRIQSVLPASTSVAREGEDEFAVLLENASPAGNRARAVGQDILEALRKPFVTQSGPLKCTASIGAALYPEVGHTVETLVRNADAAVMVAKSRGRNTLHVSSGRAPAAPLSQLKLENALRRSLRLEAFDIHLQPIYDLFTGVIHSCEALLRWEPPEGFQVSTEEVVRTLEDTGLIGEVGRLVLRLALERLAALRQLAGFERLRVAVNLSPLQFSREFLVDEVVEELARFNLPAEVLDIEVTESLVLDVSRDVKATLKELNALGIRIAIDDFGTGYSSLAYLSRFQCDTIKIDREFIRNIGTSEGEASVRAIIGLAREMGVQVVAEGVEEQEQLEFLVAEGCRLAQGFFLARPSRYLDASHATTDHVRELTPPRDLHIDSEPSHPEHVLSALPEAVLEFDATGRFVATHGRSTWVGMPLRDVVGKSLTELFPPAQARTAIAAIRRALKTDLVQVVKFAMDHPKGAAHFEARLSRTEAGTVIMTARGVSEWVRTRRQLQVRTGELLRAQRQIEQFAFLLHQQLTGPVSGARSELDRLHVGTDPNAAGDKGPEALGAHIDRIEKVVEGLLTMSKGSGASTDRVPLESVVEDVTTALAERLADRGATIRKRRLPVVEGAPWQLRIALASLCENALEHGEATRIDITSRLQGEAWEIVVRDNGKGIDAVHTGRIFTPFFVGKQSPGLGIGLTLSRRIFRRHGGDLKLLDSSEHGTSFLITLPVPA